MVSFNLLTPNNLNASLCAPWDLFVQKFLHSCERWIHCSNSYIGNQNLLYWWILVHFFALFKRKMCRIKQLNNRWHTKSKQFPILSLKLLITQSISPLAGKDSTPHTIMNAWFWLFFCFSFFFCFFGFFYLQLLSNMWMAFAARNKATCM